MIVVAKIGRAHGIKGDVRVRFFSDDPLACCERGVFYREANENSPSLRVKSFNLAGNTPLVGFEGVDDRTKAEGLGGSLLYQPRKLFPAPGPDEYYYIDLIGLTVIDGSTRGAFGRVKDVFSNGANEILEIATDDGKIVNLPFISDVVLDVNLQDKTLTLSDSGSAFF